MSAGLPRPCLDCGELSPGPRCAIHAKAVEAQRNRKGVAARGPGWQRRSAAMLAAWRRQGLGCQYPGCGTLVDLTVHHVIPASKAPDTAVTGRDYVPMCRRHNSALGAS
jgi:5-methylcytosine-specific restriction endonuclease McrA